MKQAPRPVPPRTHAIAKEIPDDGEVVNDSLGTIDPADSTGIDDEKETGDAEQSNSPTRED